MDKKVVKKMLKDEAKLFTDIANLRAKLASKKSEIRSLRTAMNNEIITLEDEPE